MDKNFDLEAFCKKMQDGIVEVTTATVNEAARRLKDKYGCEFVADKIGDRFNRDTSTIYFHQKDDIFVPFIAKINKATNETTDNYVRRIVATKVGIEIETSLMMKNIETAAFVLLYGDSSVDETELDISVEEYFSRYNVEKIFIYLALNDENIRAGFSSDFINEFVSLSARFGKKIVVFGFFIGEDFEQCKTDLRLSPKVSDAWFDFYKKIRSFSLNVSDGKCSLSSDEFEALLQGGE